MCSVGEVNNVFLLLSVIFGHMLKCLGVAPLVVFEVELCLVTYETLRMGMGLWCNLCVVLL